eukprot:TRINITY_DN5690_c0_g1_i1.p1 TRINITY_DN5690_c0_g1~~TRINITY_DN5690_c0_g1_i1.p1  ORF type:complete len:507 (-),score=120.50 TRINITY_DN5690_c0_g1_i1:98-1618(-)
MCIRDSIYTVALRTSLSMRDTLEGERDMPEGESLVLPNILGDDEPKSNEPALGKKADWTAMSWLLLSDVVGSSVLSFSGVTASLGWVLSIVCMILFCYLAYWSACLMSSTRTMIQQKCNISTGSMGQTAKLLLGERASQITFFAVYGMFAFLGNASYLLVLGTSLSSILRYWNVSTCSMTSSMLACIIILPSSVTIRRLRNVATMCFFNLFLILAVLVVCLTKMAQTGRADHVETHLFEPTMTLLSFCQAMANILYAYAGHWMYFEIMAEMEEPTDFPKVFWINAPLQLLLYMTVAVIGYYYVGSGGHHYLIDNLEEHSESRLVVEIMLFVHIAISYLIKNVALAQFVVGKVRPSAVESNSKRARMVYGLCSVSILCMGWVVANAMPVFYDLLSLIGALLCGPISYVLPISFFVLGCMALQDKSEPASELEHTGLAARQVAAVPSIAAVWRHVKTQMAFATTLFMAAIVVFLSLIHISEPTRLLSISYAVFCLKKKKKKSHITNCE